MELKRTPEKILIAEDDLTSRKILEVILTNWGFEVVVTTNGFDAFEQLNLPAPPRINVVDLS